MSKGYAAMIESESEKFALAERLREAREYVGLSQDEVATKLGLTRPAVTNIESGSRKVSATELSAFAKLYGRSLDYLVNGKGTVVAENEKVAFLARAARDLTKHDLRELAQFAEFLRNRPKAGR